MTDIMGYYHQEIDVAVFNPDAHFCLSKNRDHRTIALVRLHLQAEGLPQYCHFFSLITLKEDPVSDIIDICFWFTIPVM